MYVEVSYTAVHTIRIKKKEKRKKIQRTVAHQTNIEQLLHSNQKQDTPDNRQNAAQSLFKTKLAARRVLLPPAPPPPLSLTPTPTRGPHLYKTRSGLQQR